MLADLIPILAQRTLTPEEIRAAVAALLDASFPDETKADFLRAWAQRGETADELAACAEAILPRALDPGVRGSWNGKPLLDCSGTGGGGLPLINISTGIMFILAALGIPVVKHGNRALTKTSGSADVLEALGLRIDLAPEQVIRCLEEVGCAFLFAPKYHLSFAAVAPVRRQLGAQGRRTVFNLLGPLLNPARPDARIVGVFQPEHLELYEKALRRMGCPRFAIVYGKDEASGKALGEASVTGPNVMRGTPWEGTAQQGSIHSSYQPYRIETAFVANATESATRLENILQRKEMGLARHMLVANAALAAQTAGFFSSFEEAQAQCDQALESGRAHERLNRWREFSRRSA